MSKRDEIQATVEWRLADLIEGDEVLVSDYRLSDHDRMTIVKALRDRARWMASDITSGETSGEKPKKRHR